MSKTIILIFLLNLGIEEFKEKVKKFLYYKTDNQEIKEYLNNYFSNLCSLTKDDVIAANQVKIFLKSNFGFF